MDIQNTSRIPVAQIYRIPQDKMNVIEEVIATHTEEEASVKLRMLLISGIKDSYYNDGAYRQDVTILIHDLLRLLEVSHHVFENNLNHYDEVFEDSISEEFNY